MTLEQQHFPMGGVSCYVLRDDGVIVVMFTNTPPLGSTTFLKESGFSFSGAVDPPHWVAADEGSLWEDTLTWASAWSKRENRAAEMVREAERRRYADLGVQY